MCSGTRCRSNCPDASDYSASRILARKASPSSSAFRCADAVDVRSAIRCRRLEPRHLAQRRVVEDDVRRHAARAGDLEAQRAQALEQIAIDALPRLGLDPRPRRRAAVLDRPPLPRQRQVRARSSRPSAARRPRRSAPAPGYSSSVWRSKPCADQLLDVAAHLGDRRVAQQAERAQRVVAARWRPARSRCRAARWRRAPRRSAGRRAPRTTGSSARASTGSATASSSSEAVVAGAAVGLARSCSPK